MSVLSILILIISAFLTSVISATVGMAGGIVLLSVMTFFMDLSLLVPIHGIVQLASNSSRTLSLLKNVKMKILWPALLGLPVGTLIAVYLIRSIENKEIFYLLIAALIFYVLFKPKKMPKIQIPYGYAPLGVLVGFLSPLVGATGPLLAPFFLREDLSKEEIVATKAATQTATHVFKVPAFLYLGFNYLQHWLLILLMVVGVILGTQAGVKILRRIDEKSFRLIFKSALFLAALRLIYKSISSIF